MSALEEALRDLARESGRLLGELGVRSDDRDWIAEHVRAIASLAEESRSRRLLPRLWRRLRGVAYLSARKAARTAR